MMINSLITWKQIVFIIISNNIRYQNNFLELLTKIQVENIFALIEYNKFEIKNMKILSK